MIMDCIILLDYFQSFYFISYRTDVIAILMTCENLLWSVCGSMQELLDSHKDRNPRIYNIHRYCNNLLAAALFLTSPLENLYK